MLTKEKTMSLKDNKRYLLLNKMHLKVNFEQGRCATEQLQLVYVNTKSSKRFNPFQCPIYNSSKARSLASSGIQRIPQEFLKS